MTRAFLCVTLGGTYMHATLDHIETLCGRHVFNVDGADRRRPFEPDEGITCSHCTRAWLHLDAE